jgi:shikimate kinase
VPDPTVVVRRPLPPLASRHVVVVGLMASGKTSVAAALAARLGRELRDSDADIAAATGRSVRELAATEGPDAMHDREAAHLLRALAADERAVIAAAASTIERDDCRRALAARAVTVWLDVATDVLAARFAAGGHRPDFGRPVVQLLADQRARRAPLFAGSADVVVRDPDASPVEIADAVLAALGAA